MNSRIFSALVLTLFISGCTALTRVESESARAPATYSLPPLPYKYSDLEPAIDSETMKIHHSRHHQTYVDNLNKALVGVAHADLPLEQLLKRASSLPLAIRNNGGGHFNHTFFWSIMTPQRLSGHPSAALHEAISKSFGSFDKFKEEFSAAATSRFGSGWAWLIKTPTGLKVISTPNQDNPLMDCSDITGEPLLAVDVWEHAYYLKYRNKRAEYLKNWWSVVNWGEVSRLFEAT